MRRSATTSGSRSRRSPSTRVDDVSRRARDELRPTALGDLGHGVGKPACLLRRHPARSERAVAALDRRAAPAACPAPAPRRRPPAPRGGRAADGADQGYGIVALGDQRGADVSHEQRRAPPVASVPACGPDHGVVDAVGESVEEARSPHRHGSAAEVAEAAHRPVVVGVQVLEHHGLPVDHDPFQHRAGLGVAGGQRGARGRAARSSSTDEATDRGTSAACTALSMPPKAMSVGPATVTRRWASSMRTSWRCGTPPTSSP